MARGTEREVIAGDMDEPVTVETFTVAQAAEALCKSESTLRRWIQEGIFPEPMLEDTSRHTMVYSVGELQVIARILHKHEKTGSYLTRTDLVTINELLQAVHGYRSRYV